MFSQCILVCCRCLPTVPANEKSVIGEKRMSRRLVGFDGDFILDISLILEEKDFSQIKKCHIPVLITSD